MLIHEQKISNSTTFPASRLTLAQNTVVLRLTTAVLLITIGLYCVLGTQARMEADDYGHAQAASTYGIVGSLIESYTSWSGRFAHLLVAGILWNLFGERLPAILPTVLLIGLTLSCWWALRPVSRHAGIAALGITVALLAALPAAALWQGVYWVAGSLTYVTPLILWLLCAGCILRRGPFWLVGLLAFFAAGFNETAAAVQLLAAVVIFAYRRDRLAAALLVGSTLGLAVMALAPGNAVRSARLESMTLMDALLATAAGSVLFVIERLQAVPGSLLLALFAASLVRPPATQRRRNAAIVAAATLVGIAASVFPILYMSHTTPPARINVMITTMLIVGVWLFGAFTLPRKQIFMIAVCLAAIWVSLQTVNLVRTRLPDMISYATAWDRGDKALGFVCLGQLETDLQPECGEWLQSHGF